jgi:hypothetical protein
MKKIVIKNSASGSAAVLEAAEAGRLIYALVTTAATIEKLY